MTDAEAAREIEAGGGRLIADYGSFRLMEAGPAALAAVGVGRVEDRGEEDRILLNAGEVDTRSDAARAGRRLAAGFAGKRLHLVQFAGPVKPEWLEELEACGGRVVTYIPHNAYLVYGDAAALGRVRAMAGGRPFVQWEGTYDDADKVQPAARREQAKSALREPANDTFAVQMVNDADANAASLAVIDSLRLAPYRRMERKGEYLNLVVRLPLGQVDVVASLPEVVSIQSYPERKKFDERQDQIVAGNLNGTGSAPTNAGYLAWLYGRGFTQDQFTASGFVVDITDSGVDRGTNPPNHFGLYVSGDTALASRVAYNRLEGTKNAGSTNAGCDGHGNINAHIIAGYNDRAGWPHTDSNGYHYGLGVCPFVRVGSSVIFDPDSFTYPDYEDLISRAYRDGARISSDSWGADTAGDYDIDAQRYDYLVRDAQPAGAAVSSGGNQEMTIVFAAGNAGSAAQTVGSPGTAKNVITVGAAENVHSHATTNGGNNTSGNDGCYTPDTEANNANDIASFSSRGPCDDLRKKPEIVAPGTHITGGVAQQSPLMTGTGDDHACFEATGVCALPGGGTAGDPDNFFPKNQQWWTTSSGTSHSTPAVAGGCALVRQYFLNLGRNAPSPAMVKAYLMNAARYMTGTSANDTLWSDSQGMGGMNLGFAFDGADRVLRDQLTNDLFTASGQARTFTATVSETGKPFRVTLSWTDAPGSTSGNAYKNNLDLAVTIGGQTYKGNVFNGAYSTNGGSADVRNNTESVFLRAGQTGVVVVTVTAYNINSDGVPNYGGSLDQDFALVVYNATEGAADQPPMLDPIGNKSVVTNTLLSFAVRASDPFDGDTVRLWATGVPGWATFAGATNAGAATNTFSGTPAATGTWVTTFYAGDKDGTNSEAVTINVTESSPVLPRDIGGWLLIQSNSTINYTIPAGTTLSPGGYVVVARAVTKTQFETFWGVSLATNVIFLRSTNSLPSINGDEMYTLKSNATALADGPTPAALNPLLSSIQRLSANSNGTLAASWRVVSASAATPGTGGTGDGTGGIVINEYSDALGTGSFSNEFVELYYDAPGASSSNTPPVLNPIGSQSVVVSNTLQFAVSATPTEGDPVTLTVSNAPAGTHFASSGENGAFYWTNASPVGVYTATFYAADAGGVDFEQVLITVQAAAGGGGGGTETFTNVNAPAAYYGSGSYVGDGGIQWTYSGARKPDATYDIDGQTIGFGDSLKNPREVYSSTIPGGVGDLSVKYRKYFTAAGTRSFDVYVNGAVVGSVADANNTTPQTQTFGSVNIAGDVVIKVSGTGGKQFVIDTLSWTSYATADSNGNGIPDDWEIVHFGNLTNTAAGDNDFDFFSNYEEYVADTDPLNPDSLLRLDLAAQATARDIVFRGTNTRLYSVEHSADLLDGAGWGGLQSGMAGTNGWMTVGDTNDAASRAYRVRVEVP